MLRIMAHLIAKIARMPCPALFAGHVIASLVDLQSGRSRHVPYRDSRLTFLLQARNAGRRP